MFTCPTCNADRSRILPIDPCPACGALLVQPETDESEDSGPPTSDAKISADDVSAASDPDFDPDATVADTEAAGLAALKVADLLDQKASDSSKKPSAQPNLPPPLAPVPNVATGEKESPKRKRSDSEASGDTPSSEKITKIAPMTPPLAPKPKPIGIAASTPTIKPISPPKAPKVDTPKSKKSTAAGKSSAATGPSIKSTLLGVAALPPAASTTSPGDTSAPPSPVDLPQGAKKKTPNVAGSTPVVKTAKIPDHLGETPKAQLPPPSTVDVPAKLSAVAGLEVKDSSGIDELETAILPPVSSSVKSQKISESSPFNTDMKPENSLESSPFDETDASDVLTKTVADMSVDIAVPVKAAGKPGPAAEAEPKFPRAESPDILTRTVADAMVPILTPTPSVVIEPAPMSAAPVSSSAAVASPAVPTSSAQVSVSPVSNTIASRVAPTPSVSVPGAPVPAGAVSAAPVSSSAAIASPVAPVSSTGSVRATLTGAPVHTPAPMLAPSAVLPVVQPAAATSPSQLLPRPPSSRPSDVLPRPGSASPFPTSNLPVSSINTPGPTANMPAAYALPEISSAVSQVGTNSSAEYPAVPGYVSPAQSGGYPDASVPTLAPVPGLPPTIGPPPELSTPSYPDAALSALSDESESAGNVNQVWRQAHPSAQRWAQKRQVGAPRTPKPGMIAIGLMLAGLGGYLLGIFLPSKAPLSAAAKELLLTQAGVDENAWRFTDAFMTVANINAALFIVLGLVVFLRGALFRQPVGQTRAAGKKTSILLVFCFVLLALSFGSLLLFASLG